MSALKRLGQPSNLTSRAWYLLLAAGAVIAGILFRFWDLGGAPLAVDEYFLGMATLNTLEHGLPRFDCGGYYKRGLLLQYLTLPLLHFGVSLEFAVRFWPAVASLVSILAVWRISEFTGQRGVGVVAVILVSLSLWEIEFGRFGRMYAPFQAAFLWYVYFQIQHLVHGKESARWWYLGTSAIAVLIYEGAALLLVTNFVALIWRGKRWTASHLAIAAGLIVATVVYFKTILTRFPDSNTAEVASPIGDTGQPLPKPDTFEKLTAMPNLPEHLWLVAIAAVCVLAFLLWRYSKHLEIRHPSAVYWFGAVLCFSAGLMAFGAALTLAAVLLNIPCPLRDKAVNWRSMAIGLMILSALWVSVLFLSFLFSEAGMLSSAKSALRYVFDYPDVLFKVVAPWIHTIPATTVILGLPAAVALWRGRHRQGAQAIDYLAGISILLILLLSILPQPYESTRYTYFLYPLLIILAAVGLVTTVEKAAGSAGNRTRFVLTMVLMAPLFVVAEDFRLSHLFRINQPEIRFRSDYSLNLATHYYLRWDFRGAANFVNERATPNDTILAFDQPFPYYLEKTDGFYAPQGTSNHELVAACDDTRDLWSNAPLLDQESEVDEAIDSRQGRVWLLMRSDKYPFRDPIERALPERYGLTPEFVSVDGHLAVFMIAGKP